MHPPPVETTANKLLLGKICSLESYRALNDKEQLLDEVIRTGNGDGILAVNNHNFNRNRIFIKILFFL